MRRIIFKRRAAYGIALIASLAATAAFGQMPGGMGQTTGRPTPGGGMGPSVNELSMEPHEDKPDAAAKKAYAAGMKSLKKAREYEEAAAKATTPAKKDDAAYNMNEAYGRALDQFTQALRNSGDMVDAWNNVGYVHLRLGAYGESIDDYNHALKLKPELEEAIEHRAEAYMAVDRLDDAKSAYMDLFNHARPLADQLMTDMQTWEERHRTDAAGMRPSDVDSFGKWLQERDGIAKQTASVQGEPSPHP